MHGDDDDAAAALLLRRRIAKTTPPMTTAMTTLVLVEIEGADDDAPQPEIIDAMQLRRTFLSRGFAYVHRLKHRTRLAAARGFGR
jgi:hypothetical protein